MSRSVRACYRLHRQYFPREDCKAFVSSVARRAAEGDPVAIDFLTKF